MYISVYIYIYIRLASVMRSRTVAQRLRPACLCYEVQDCRATAASAHGARVAHRHQAATIEHCKK